MKTSGELKMIDFIKIIFTAVFVSFLLVATVTWTKIPASPSPLFVFIVCLSLKQGNSKSLVISSVCGFLLDLLCQNTILTNAITYAYISLGCVIINQRVKISLKSVILCVFLASFIMSSINVLMFTLSFQGSFSFWLTEKILPETLFNAVLTPVIYPFAYMGAAK